MQWVDLSLRPVLDRVVRFLGLLWLNEVGLLLLKSMAEDAGRDRMYLPRPKQLQAWQ